MASVITSDKIHVHAHVLGILRKRQISLKENTLVYFLSRAVCAYANGGQAAVDSYLAEQFFTMLNGIDDASCKSKGSKRGGKILVSEGKRVYNVCGPIKDGAIRARLYAYFQGQKYGDDALELHEDSAGYFAFVPSAMDLQAMRKRVKAILNNSILE